MIKIELLLQKRCEWNYIDIKKKRVKVVFYQTLNTFLILRAY